MPEATHAANADNAINAQTAAKAASSDAVGGIPAAELMTTKVRSYEANFGEILNFGNEATLESLTWGWCSC